MEKKVNANVVAVVAVIKGLTAPATYAEVCDLMGRKVGSGVFNQAVKSGFIASADADFECNLVRVDTGAVVGHAKKTVKVYSFVKDAE